jgi:hypothetical protein
MGPGVLRRIVLLAALAGAALFIGLNASASSAKPLPRGCNLEYRGQLISAFVNQRKTFRFEMYNAVPPGHRIDSVRFAWGDGKSSRGTARTRKKAMFKGCYTTIFTGTHTFKHVDCANGLCSRTYKVRLTYRDRSTKARATNTLLRVIAVKRTKQK